MILFYYKIGQQEYSARTAGATSGIILAVLLPLALCILYIGYRVFKNYNKNDTNSWLLNPPSRSASRLKLNEHDPITPSSRTISPTTPPFDEEFNEYTYRSPIGSDRSSSSTSSKKRRSYDKTYRTHEPLEGVPEIDFEDKEWDLDTSLLEPDYEPSNKLNGNNKTMYQRSESVDPDYLSAVTQPVTTINPQLSQSNPNLIDYNTPYGLNSHSPVDKLRADTLPFNRLTTKSQSSIVTDV